MDFRSASGRATDACITLADIAEEVDIAPQTVRRARMDPSSPNYRTPPRGWRKAIAKLARERSAELAKLAEELGR